MKNTHVCYIHIILLRLHFSQNVKYWNEIRDVLVLVFTCCEELIPIFSVKFAKCEICGSTKLIILYLVVYLNDIF